MEKFRNPFVALRHWAQRHHNSLSSFTSNFIATVLGIVLTFGTTMWYENREKKEAAETLVENYLYIPEARRLWSGEITKEEFVSEADKRWNEWASSQQ